MNELGVTMAIRDVLHQALNEPQRRVAEDSSGTILCLACAGSGKTRTLAYRTARLIDNGVPPEAIVAFTFTEKAAESLKRQIASALSAADLPPTLVGAMYVGTIHAYCQYVLGEMDARYRQFDVLDENRLKLYLISRFAELGLFDLKRARGARYFEIIREVSDAWKMMNDELLDPADVAVRDSELGSVLVSLMQRLDADEFIDFSLMIRLVADALEQNNGDAQRATMHVKHVMVDEYQDVNASQERLIRQLKETADTLLVVGDDDQSIYGWRGADVTNILTFPDRYSDASVHTLSHNYRSTPEIVESADSFASAELGATRIAKNPEADATSEPRQIGRFFFDSREEEAKWVAERISALLGTAYRERDGSFRGLTAGDFAILMRSTRSSEQTGLPRHAMYTNALADRGIPYSLEATGGVFDRPQVAVLAESFELLRDQSPTRAQVRLTFDHRILHAFPRAHFDSVAQVFAAWGRRIHAPRDGVRRRVYPQQLVHELLQSFGIAHSDFDSSVMADIGVFSRIIQDVEAVYLSIDSANRFQQMLNFLSNVADSGYDAGTDDVLRRPDAVTISTVHKAKGLEFPVVIVADVESARFPGAMRGYGKWIPEQLIADALARGAYQSSRDEEARLFYTAITRAERFLYVCGSASLPGGTKTWKQSPFAQRLTHASVIDEPETLPPGISDGEPSPRIDETIVPTSYSDIRYFLRCPRDYQFRNIFGFSPPITEMFGFGKTVHTAVTKLHEVFRETRPTREDAETLVDSTFHLKHVPPSGDPDNRPGGFERAKESARDIVGTYAESYGEDFLRRRQVEVRFEIPVTQAVISGAIDLMLQVDEEGIIRDASVIDFKAMEGGADPVVGEQLRWTELSLQVQLYAKAAREVLGERARTGAVHLLKDNQRIEVPVDSDAVAAAVNNVEWAVDRILHNDFPMRPHPTKCANCDFQLLCPMIPQDFSTESRPAELHLPSGRAPELARSFSEFESGAR